MLGLRSSTRRLRRPCGRAANGRRPTIASFRARQQGPCTRLLCACQQAGSLDPWPGPMPGRLATDSRLVPMVSSATGYRFGRAKRTRLARSDVRGQQQGQSLSDSVPHGRTSRPALPWLGLVRGAQGSGGPGCTPPLRRLPGRRCPRHTCRRWGTSREAPPRRPQQVCPSRTRTASPG